MFGTIKKIVDDKGFGFITPDNKQRGDRDIFFHASGLQGLVFAELQLDQRVEFSVEANDERGPRAVNVTAAE